MGEKTEQEHWLRFLGMNVSFTKNVNGNELYYRGEVVDVLTDKLILNDRKLGEIPLTFEGLSIIGINNGGEGQ